MACWLQGGYIKDLFECWNGIPPLHEASSFLSKLEAMRCIAISATSCASQGISTALCTYNDICTVTVQGPVQSMLGMLQIFGLNWIN